MPKKGRKESSKKALPKGPGPKLKVAREACKLTVDEVAAQLRLSPHRLSGIEVDDYRQLGSSAFARGYLRNYARLLGVSEKEILQEFDEQKLSETITVTKPNLIAARRGNTFFDRLTRWIVAVLISGSIIAAITWWLSNQDNPTEIFSLQKIKEAEKAVKNAVSSRGHSDTVIVQPLPIQNVTQDGSSSQPLVLPKAGPMSLLDEAYSLDKIQHKLLFKSALV